VQYVSFIVDMTRSYMARAMESHGDQLMAWLATVPVDMHIVEV